MSQVNGNTGGKRFWRSLDEVGDTPAFRMFYDREFQPNATEMDENSRRTFLKLMGASFALAGVTLTSCRQPEEYITPYAHRPEGKSPGTPEFFATSMELGGAARGLLVKSYDGRPIKIEGNPSHPINRSNPFDYNSGRERMKGVRVESKLGASSAFEQAAILEMYDPDRSTTPVLRERGGKGTRKTVSEFREFAAGRLAKHKTAGGKGLYFLSESTSSPAIFRLRKKILSAMPEAKFHEYEPVSGDAERIGTQLVFGRPMRVHPMFTQAKTIVSFDSDFLMTHPSAVRNAHDFASRRSPDFDMSRFFAFECGHTVTGSNADYRKAVGASEIASYLAALTLELIEGGVAVFGAAEMKPALEKLAGSAIGDEMVKTAALSLRQSRAAGMVLVGFEQPAQLHALAAIINAALGNAGKSILYTEVTDPDRAPYLDSIKTLTENINAGKVETLIILGGNPVYSAPADLQFGESLSKIDAVVHVSLYDDETSQLSLWHVPRAHFLESWGDSRAVEGTYCLTQPLIEPLYGGLTDLEILAIFCGDSSLTSRELVRASFDESYPYGEIADKAFDAALSEGCLPPSFWQPQAPEVVSAAFASGLENLGGGKGEIEITFRPSYCVFDGRFANNGWLQVNPDPMTKLTWDNAALISPKLAESKKIRSGDVVGVSAGGDSVKIPAFVLPGQPENTITLVLGYGRKRAGRVGSGVGVDVYPLRKSGSLHFASGADVRKTGKRKKLAATQDHHAIDVEKLGSREKERRLGELTREATLGEYKEHPDFAKHKVHHPPLESLWREHEYDGHKWAMSIDLNSCIGCGACQIACQAENNIPVVSKDEVARGREMQWIRVDRYFSGDIHSPRVLHQPVTCHHCENAPCEQVCPVAATVHSSEGLNEMVYNRCVGTKYCANNCPYKVRRFNFFNNHKNMTEVEKLGMNPDVTVRSRGVMEKCSFCVQRIQEVKINAKNEGRAIVDGEVVPACAQACPAKAITFGDLNDPSSRVKKAFDHNRSYGMLAELNVKPRLEYMAKVRNVENGAPGAAHDEYKEHTEGGH